MLNFIISCTVCFLFIIFIKESFTIHMGILCSYSNAPWIFAALLCLVGITVLNLSNRIDYVGSILGIVLAIIYLAIATYHYHKCDKKDQKNYEEERKIKKENINEEKLKELLALNREKGIEPEERYCNCSCPFLSETFENCEIKKMYYEENIEELYDSALQEIAEDDYGCDYALRTLCDCSYLYCPVFGCTVDPITECVWDKQKGLCLLAQCQKDDELNKFIEGMKKPFTNANGFILGTTGGGKGHHPEDD